MPARMLPTVLFVPNRFLWITILCIALLSMGIALPTAAAEDAPVFEPTDCLLITHDVETTCGYVTVPENRENPTKNTIRLYVVIIPNSSGIENAPGIVYLAGGPGGSGTLDVDSWAGFPLLDTHDFILFDQRGTGLSQPSLNCPEVESEESDDPLSACRDRLIAEGIDLSSYTSAENAADVDAVRQALGYKVWALYGVSYGTKLALTTMRDYPDGISAVILDAVYPPNVNSTETEGPLGVRAIERMLDACAADANCGAAFPDLKANYYTWLEGLNNAPLNVSEVDYDASSIYELIFQAMYDSEAIKGLPLAIAQAIDGDLSALIEMGGGEGLGKQDPNDPDTLASLDTAEGMQFSVECAEETPFADQAVAVANAEKTPAALREALIAQVEKAFAECALWDVREAHAIENEAVVSDIPTLVFNGELDPITPPEWGELAAKTLSRSYLFTFPGLGHGAFGTAECPTEIGRAFIANPMEEPDGACLDQMSPEFYTE